MNRPRIQALVLAISAAAIAALTGCDLNENADLDNGRQLFSQQCGTCHALKEAGSTTQRGPDLDAAFAAARAAGRSLTPEQAIAEATADEPTAGAGLVHPRLTSAVGSLSRREHEIARLVARGRTNREIAAALHISERTADAHVRSLLRKLGVASRAEVARALAAGDE